MSELTQPTREQAEHWMREVTYQEAAVGAELSATAGQSPRRLTCVGMVGAFLQPIDHVSIETLHDTINYVNPVGLAEWVSGTIGDAELGAALLEIANEARDSRIVSTMPSSNRLVAARYMQGRRVLDMFCYTGGFAMAAAKLGGASEVLAVDGSKEPFNRLN